MPRVNPSTVVACGRYRLHGEGITIRPVLGFLGRAVRIAWAEIRAWSSTRMLRTTLPGEVGQVVAKILEIQTPQASYQLSRSAHDTRYDAFVQALNARLPDKRVSSMLEQIHRAPPHLRGED